MPTQSRFLPLNSTTNTTGSGFLDMSDITDKLAQRYLTDTNIQNWLDLVDGEVLSLAQEREVPLTSISMPLHKKILEYCKCYFCVVCFQDNYGLNNVSQTNMNETLKLKLDFYMARCETLRLQCTKEMFLYTNMSLQSSQRVGGTKSILRG